jgi:hypothetical protein
VNRIGDLAYLVRTMRSKRTSVIGHPTDGSRQFQT